MSDKVIIGLLIIYIILLAIGISFCKNTSYALVLNIATSISVLLYWIFRFIKISDVNVDKMQIGFISFEIIVLTISSYLFFSKKEVQWATILPYILLSIHMLAAILFIVFMMAFKINRLM